MNVLVACEYSGRVRDAFTRAGHFAMSCDLLPTDSPGLHYQGDVTEILNMNWDLMIAHPPCTYLSVSGMHWATRGLRDPQLTEDALDFVRLLMDAPVPRIAIENPISVISSRIRKPDQIIHPYHFGHDASKATCLWLKNLPELTHTHTHTSSNRESSTERNDGVTRPTRVKTNLVPVMTDGRFAVKLFKVLLTPWLLNGGHYANS
jgi:hypothetical protein